MREHPLPALPHEEEDEVQCETHSQIGRKTSVLKRSGETYALFDDTSEIDLKASSCSEDEHHGVGAFPHAATLPGDLPISKPLDSATCEAYTSCSSANPSQRSREDSVERGASYAPEEEEDSWWSTCDAAPLPHTFRQASCDAVCDLVPDTTLDQPYTYCLPVAEYNIGHDAPMDPNDEPHREILVHFADAHTILCTPPPPTPPPHRSLSAITLSLPSASPRLKPYGPRIPPWGSSDNLDHERRLRTDFRSLEDTLDEQFDEREKLRKETEARNGKRRTEGEELRELVLGIYPEMEEGKKERSWCLCVVM
jgi:hypothetical protein